MTDRNDAARAALVRIIRDYGCLLGNDARRCEALLKDFCPNARAEVHLLVAAARSGVPKQLMSSPAGSSRESIAARLAKMLEEDYAVTAEAARWAVESWSQALGVTVTVARPKALVAVAVQVATVGPARQSASGAKRGMPSSKLRWGLPLLALVLMLGATGGYRWWTGREPLQGSLPVSAVTAVPIPARSETKPPAPVVVEPVKPSPGTLLVSTDADCALTIDGKAQGRLRPGARQIFWLAAGEHLVACTSTLRPAIAEEQSKAVTAGQQSAQTFKLSTKLAEVQKADDAKEAERTRLAAEAKQREEAQRVEAARVVTANRMAKEQRQAEAARLAAEKPRASEKRFVANGDGTVSDSKTGVVWADRDNGSNVNWDTARQYCAGKGAGWQLPTVAQLQGLFDASGKYTQRCLSWTCPVTPLIRLSSIAPWSSETNGSFEAWIVDLTVGTRYSNPVAGAYVNRALCVRRS